MEKRFGYVASPLQMVQKEVANTSSVKAIQTAYHIVKHLAVSGVEKVSQMGCIAVSGILAIDVVMNIYNPVWNDEKEADAKSIRRRLIENSDFVFVVDWLGKETSKEVLEDIEYAKKLGKEIVYEGRE